MGEGDFKLSAALGAWLGAQSIGMIALGAGLSLLAVVLVRALFKRPIHKLAFGPALAIAGITYLFIFL